MNEYVPTIPFIRERPHVFSSRRVLDRGLMAYFKQREEEGETQTRILSAKSQRLRSLAASYMDLSPNDRKRIPTSMMHGYQFDERANELYSFDENAVYKVEVTTLGKLRILKKIRDLTDVDKRHVFDDPFRYKVISPFRIISPVEVISNANGMRQGDWLQANPPEGVAGDNFGQAQPPPGQFPPGDGGDWDNQVYPPPSPPPGDGGDQWFDSPNQPEPGNGSDNQGYPLDQPGLPGQPGQPDLPAYRSSPSPLPGLLNFNQGIEGSFPPLFLARDPINSAPVSRNKKEDEIEEIDQSNIRFHSRQFDSNELDDIKQRFNVVRDLVLYSHSKIELILPNVYKIIIDICEEAKSLHEKKEVQEVQELLTEVLNQIDAKLHNAELELRELNALFKKLAFNTLIAVDPQVIEEDKKDIINQFNAIVNRVNEVNKRNAQILSGSSGQEVIPIKVEAKVESTPGARPSEFMESVVTAYDNVKEEEKIGHDYYKSFSNAKNAQKFEEKNKSLQRSKGSHFSLEKDEPQSNLPNISIPQKREGTRYGLNVEDLQRMNAQQASDRRNKAKRGKTTRPPLNVPNAQQGQAQGFTYTPHQKPVIKDNTAGEEIQEEVKNDVINISSEKLGIVKQEAEKYSDPPKTDKVYIQFLRDHKLEEYIDGETGECDYFYYWYRILSGNSLPKFMFYGKAYSDIKSFFFIRRNRRYKCITFIVSKYL